VLQFAKNRSEQNTATEPIKDETVLLFRAQKGRNGFTVLGPKERNG
jgi:hypothetical protein